MVATMILAAASSDGAEKLFTDGSDVSLSIVNHASFALKTPSVTILADPVGGGDKFKSFGSPDIILITDIHGDHMEPGTLKALADEKTTIVAPQAVVDKLPEDLKKKALVLANGEVKSKSGIKIEALPMYNLTPERAQYHSKGRGNGYVLTIDKKRIYISGDTEDIPEMRKLKDIDVAFVCMNLPYTMTVQQAASAVKEFKPRVVYPYHYRGSDIDQFKKEIGTEAGVEVRNRDWYVK
ncbi:MAG: metal-dependent hydrolase [Verrucomicrobiales bacterium]|nr:metal-dependent hydrolase [Verrucomicrobiales bacterium]MDB6128988.1 metal-dependent hydrolase [Verrucomicrobiales bacterium]